MHRALAKQLRIDPLSNLYGQPREQRALGLWVDLDRVTFRGLWWRRHWPSGWRQWHRGVFAQRYIGAAGVIVDAGLAEDVFLKVTRGGVVLGFAAKALQKPRHDAQSTLEYVQRVCWVSIDDSRVNWLCWDSQIGQSRMEPSYRDPSICSRFKSVLHGSSVPIDRGLWIRSPETTLRLSAIVGWSLLTLNSIGAPKDAVVDVHHY